MYVLFLASYKGLKVLEAAIEKQVKLRLVIVGRDIKISNDYSKEIVSMCLENSIKYTFTVKDIEYIKTDIMLAVSWQRLIHNPFNNLIIFHDSLLPEYRGFAPLVNMLIQGERKIGVTTLFAEITYDTGPIILQKAININYPIKIIDAISDIVKIYKFLAYNIFDMEINKIKGIAKKQDNSKASYSIWRDTKDYKIDWAGSSLKILRHIHAVGYPYRGALTTLEKKNVRILDAEIVPDVRIINRDIGKVIFNTDGFPIVICGSGLLKILEAKFEYENSSQSIIPSKRIKLRFL